MWYPSYLETINLLSHKHTNYSFKRGKLTLLFGKNLDRGPDKSNGSGKSTIFESITFAMTGDVYRDINKSEFISHGENYCQSILTLNNDILNTELIIDRKAYLKSKASELNLSSSNKELNDRCKELTSVNEANKFLFELIGIEKEDFMNYFLIGQGNQGSFFTSSDSKQKEIINRFSNVSLLDSLVESEMGELSILESNQADLQVDAAKLQAVLESIQNDVEELKEEIEQEEDNDEDIKRLNDKISKLESSNLIIEEERRLLLDSKKELEKKIESEQSENEWKRELKNHHVILEQIAEREEECESAILRLKKSQNKLKLLSSGEVECPNCKTRFIPDSDIKPDQILKELKKIDSEIKSKNKQLIEIKSEFISCEDSIDIIEDHIRTTKQIKNNLIEIERELKEKSSILISNKNLIAKYEESISEFEHEVGKQSKQRLEQLELKLLDKQKEIRKAEKSLKESIDKVGKKKEILKHLSKSGFKTYLANKSIQTIQDVTNFQLKRFDYNLQVKINGFKVLQSGELRDKIDIIVFEDGINGGSFKRYSGGEKSAIDVAGLLSIRSMINNTCDYGKGFDGLFLDEKISSLDDSGQKEAIKILSKTGVTSMVVMHHISDLDLRDDVEVVTLVKKNKETMIE